jgi:T5SS/PEP-CTERM-associated repeat protein
MKDPRPSILFLALAVLVPALARAQLVPDGATATLNNITTNVTRTVTIGTNGPFTQLILTNGAILTNSGHGVIGRNAGANSNTVRLTSLNTRWLMSSDLIVGSNGGFNRLMVTNGARAENNFGVLGFGPTSSNNEATVIGPGSLWSNRNDMYVGYVGRGNRLVIANGALVVNHSGLLGADAASADNEVVVTDAGSVWSNRASVFVGFGGHGNRLTVGKGGSVLSTNLVLGSAPEATNSRVIVNGTLRATAGRTGVLDIRRGTNQFNLGLIETDFLLMTNPLGAFEFNGGLLITHGARISNSAPFIVGRSGFTPAVWDVRNGPSIDDHLVYGSVMVGSNSSFNQLLVTNGASLSISGAGQIGVTGVARSNMVFLSGAFTRWNMAQGDMTIGVTGAVNRLVVTNGAELNNESGVLGSAAAATNNEAVVTGPGSLWKMLDTVVGAGGPGNRVVVTNGGVVTCSSMVLIGSLASSTNNRVIVDGGTLHVTNTMGNGVLHVRRGTNVLNAGLVEVDRLLVTNVLGQFELNGGTLITASTTNSNGRVFFVGNGTNSATLRLAANGIHHFNNSLAILPNGALTGNGTIIGTVTIHGQISPGASIGKLVCNNALFLQGGSQTVMEISKTGSTLTNDQVQINGGVTYAGFLRVTNVGSTTLSAGDRFQLFPASGYSGAFSAITLPPLATGLTWTNKLSFDGSIEVLPAPGPYFASTLLSGTNLIVSGTGGPTNATYFVLASTNVALPLTNWIRLLTNQFTSTGNFTFTNPIAGAFPHRFYTLQVP